MKNKILIFGKGFIGERIEEFFQCDITDTKIRNFKDAEKALKRFRPKIIINCIGHTGICNVDDCELEKDKTLFANSYIPLLLAEVALRNKIKFVHIGSGCIYNFDYVKDKPIKEERLPDFFDLYYGRTKIYAERALETLSRKYNILIARIRVPLDTKPHPRNLLTKLINYKKVIDLPNSVTYLPDFLKALSHLLKNDAKGIYNIVSKEPLRYAELLEAYRKYAPDFKYQVVNYRQLKLVRTNLVLSVKKLEDTGFKVRPVKEVLEECVKTYLKY